jgi:hypothetical protein
MDLSKVECIRKFPVELLENQSAVEELLFEVGLNAENEWELPTQIIKSNGGLKIWQYPNQFSKYVIFLLSLKPRSYLEIGCRWGGTFIFTNEFINKVNILKESIAIDIIESPVISYCNDTTSRFLQFDSHSEAFTQFMKEKYFDCIFIDGDHSYQGVKQDYLATRDNGRIFVFHDIISDACPGVVKFWNDLKLYEKDNYTFHEFTDQYDEVYQRTGQKFLGIGVAVKK